MYTPYGEFVIDAFGWESQESKNGNNAGKIYYLELEVPPCLR